MKVLLVQPPLNPNIIGAGIAYLTEPLALETIAASIPNHEVKILDMRIEPSLEQELKNFNPDVVGTTSLTPDVYIATEILQKAKEYKQDILTIIGGHHATMCPKDFVKPFIDVVTIGDGEITLKELIDKYEKRDDLSAVNGIAIQKNGNLIFSRSREMVANLDDLPLPARHLTKQYRDKYFRASWRPIASLMTSKGCPFRCNFCAVWKITNGKYKVRSAESIVNELANIEEKYIDLTDDNTLHDVKRAERIYERIKAEGIKKRYKVYARSDTIVRRPDIIEKWKEIGMDLVFIGFESFRDEDLKKLNKHNTILNNEKAIKILHKNDIEIAASFIILPSYVEEDFESLANYVKKMKLTHPIFTVLTPFPGTDLFEETSDQLLTQNYEMFDLIHSILPTKLPRKLFYKCLTNLYRKCYSENNGNDSLVSKKIMQQAYSCLAKAHELG